MMRKLKWAFTVLALSLSLTPLARAASSYLVPPPETPRPFTSTPFYLALVLVVAVGLMGFLRALVPGSWKQRPVRWFRSFFAHALRIGWLAFVPALVLDGLIYFMGSEYHHGWAVAVLALALAPLSAGLQWEKASWNARTGREETYPPAFNYFVGLALTALVPALVLDWILAGLARANLLPLAALPFNLLALGAIASSLGFGLGKLVRIILRAVIFPHRAVQLFVHPSSRYYAITMFVPLLIVGGVHYYTLPFFLEVISFSLPPVASASLDQALIICLPNLITISCVIYFSVFAGMFISMLPIILFSRALRRLPKRPPTLDELLEDPEKAESYLGRAFSAEEILPTVVTVTAYNEPADPLEKTLFGYLRLVKAWLGRGLPPDKYVILFSHQTEREDDRAAFEQFLAERFPELDPRVLIDRDWSEFDEDDPSASIRDESRLRDVLLAWVEHRGLDPDTKAGQDEYQKRRVCQRLFEFSFHAPRELFALPDPPARTYGPRAVDSWIWYYLIPKEVDGRPIQVTSKAHNLYYAREAVWGKAESSPLRRDGVFKDAEDWLFDASDADAEIHPSCVEGILSTYAPFYREPRLGWIQRLSYTIEPQATFLSSIKSASEIAYWSWFLRARIHTYSRGGKPLTLRVGDVERPIRRDFQAANGHNMVVRGTSIQAAGGDIEHEVAKVHEIESPLKRWLTKLRGQPVKSEVKPVEKWVPTGEDLELATRIALNGYYGDYASYAPQGEGSPADFRGNVPQAIRWSGNNVQLIFMHLASVFSSPRFTFNEKMGYFMNLATLASAPLLYLTVLRAAVMPFLDIPDVYGSIHASLAPLGLVLALAPNFLLLSLALSGKLVVKPTAAWQRSVFKPWHQTFLLWMGCLLVPPLSILFAAFLPGWLKAAGTELPPEAAWVLVGCAVAFNVVGLLLKRETYASLAYCIVLLPFLQVLYLAWIIFGIMGTLNMVVKTQIVEPYLSRLAGTFYPGEAGRYPADASGRFLPMNRRFPALFLPFRWVRDHHVPAAVVLGALLGVFFWLHPLPGWSGAAAAAVAFAVSALWFWRRLPGLMNDWFLDGGSLVNRWWDYWTNPQPAFVKTIKERQERPLGTVMKDNVFGLVNGLLILGLIVHVHFVNTADFSAALLAYLSFSIAASWVISPFFYEEPLRTLRSHWKVAAIALFLGGAFLAVLLGLPEKLNEILGREAIPKVLEPWLIGILGLAALGGLVNLAPWGTARAFAKRFALAFVMLALLFLSGLTVSYRGIAIEPLQESWAREADRAYGNTIREEVVAAAALEDLRQELEETSRQVDIARTRERLALGWLEEVRESQLAEAIQGEEIAIRKQQSAARLVARELERSRREVITLPRELDDRRAWEEVLKLLVERERQELERLERDLRRAQADLTRYRPELDRWKEEKPDDPLTKQFEKFVGDYEKQVVTLRRNVTEAREFLRLAREARTSTEAAEELAERQLPPLGRLAGAQRFKEQQDRAFEAARQYTSVVRQTLARAKEAFELESSRRRAASERHQLVQARFTQAQNHHDQLLGRLASLRKEAIKRWRHVYLATPRRYETAHKSLDTYRPVLEVDSARKRLEEALEWIASRHALKRVVLEGASWYPKKTLLELIRSVPEELAAFEEKVRGDPEREEEGGYIKAKKDAENLLAKRCRNLGILLIARLAEHGVVAPVHREVIRELAELHALGPERHLDDLADVDVLEPEEVATAKRVAQLLDGFGAEEAREELRRLEPQIAELEAAGDVPAEAQLARASLQSFVHLKFVPGRDEEELLAERIEKLDEKHREALKREEKQRERDRLEGDLQELAAWRQFVRQAISDGEAEHVAYLFSTIPLPSAPDYKLVRKQTLAALVGAWDLFFALDGALDACKEVEKGKEKLEVLEGTILAELDRLEPYLFGFVDVGAPEETPAYPLLLRHERDRLRQEVVEAHEILALQLEEELEAKQDIIEDSFRPRRDRLRNELFVSLSSLRQWALEGVNGFSLKSLRELLEDWKAGKSEAKHPLRTWVLDGVRQLSVESLLKRLLARKAAAAEASYLRLYEDWSSPTPGLLVRLEGAEADAQQAADRAWHSPQDVTLKEVARRKGAEADALRSEARQASQQLKADVKAVDEMQALLWQLPGATWRNGVELERLAARTVLTLDETITSAEVREEKRRQIEQEIERLREVPPGDGLQGEVRRLVMDPVLPRDDLAGAMARVVSLRVEVLRLLGLGAGDLKSPIAEPAAGGNGPPDSMPDSERPGIGRPQIETQIEQVPRSESIPEPSAPVLELNEAVRKAVSHARAPGGSIALSEQDVEIAVEELKRSNAQFLPELFGTLGVNSAASSVFQGGGFGLVTLSLDLLENRKFFQHQEEERQYLEDLAELLVTLKALRAHGRVVVTEMQENLYRTLLERISPLLEEARRVPGADPSSIAWLQLGRERLRGARLEAKMELARRKRALNSLTGRPLEAEFAAGGQTGSSLRSAAERLETWLREAGEVVKRRFPAHPAFQTLLAALEKHRAGEREAELRGTWPVFRAGAGIAAPNETLFTVGASLIFPVLDEAAELSGATARSEQETVRSREALRLFRERLKGEEARVRHRGTAGQLAAQEDLLEAKLDSLQEGFGEFRHGFRKNPVDLASEVEAVVKLVSGAGELLDIYLASGLDQIESGGKLEGVGGAAGASGSEDLAQGSSSRPAPISELAAPALPGDVSSGNSTPPAVRLEKSRVAAAEARRRREEKVIERLGVGASVSYSSLLIPMPGVELTYGVSAKRKESAEAGLRYAERRVALVELEARKAALEAHIDWLQASAAELAQERKVEALERYVNLATRLEDQGDEPPRTLRLARARAREAELALEAARLEKRRAAGIRRLLVQGAADTEITGSRTPGEFNRESVDSLIAPETVLFRGYRQSLAREALEAEVDYRWRVLVATLENKRPYGGNVANFITPLWDLVRLWNRPGTPQETRLALERFRASLLRPRTETLSEESEEFERLLDEVKDTLGGDSYDVEDVGKAVRLWRDAVLRLEVEDEELEHNRRLASLEYGSSLQELERLAARRRRLDEELDEAAVRVSLQLDSPLRSLLLEESAHQLAVEEARAVHRYAQARAAQIYYGNPLEGHFDPGLNETLVTLEDLMEAYVKSDPGVRNHRALLDGRRREMELLENMSRIRAELPQVLPFLGMDPRFGGSGMTTSMSLSLNLDRYRQLDEVREELVALERELGARVEEARISALKDLFQLRQARQEEESWRRELEARDRELERLRGRREVDSGEIREVERAREDARWYRTTAQGKVRQLEERIAGRCGGLAVGEVLILAEGASGEQIPLTGDLVREWARLAQRADIESAAMETRAEAASKTAEWRRREGWLGGKVDLIFSLGQDADEVSEGGGGFLAIPLSRLLGIGDTSRIEEIRGEQRSGEALRLRQQAGEEVKELAHRLLEDRMLLAQSLRERDLAQAGYELETRAREIRRGSAGDRELAASLLLDSESRYLQAATSHASGRRELKNRLENSGVEGVDVVGAPLLVEASAAIEPDRYASLARDLVQEVTALPRGTALEREMREVNLKLLDDGLRELETLPVEVALRRLGRLESLGAAARTIEQRADEDPELAQLEQRLLALREKEEEFNRALLERARARSLEERAALQPTWSMADLDREWEEVRPLILALEDTPEALRRALREKLEEARGKAQADLDSMEDPSREPAWAESIRLVEDTVRWEELEFERLDEFPELTDREAEERDALHAELRSIGEQLGELRKARVLDYVSRGEDHQAELREKVRRIDAHGKFRRVVHELSGTFERLGHSSPEAFRALALRFRRAQLDRAEARAGYLGASERAQRAADAGGRLLAAFDGRLEGESDACLSTLKHLRVCLRDVLERKAWYERELDEDNDVIGRSLAEAPAREIALEEEAIRKELASELDRFLGTPLVDGYLRPAWQEVSRARLEELEAEREALEGGKDLDVPTRALPIETALAALRKVLEDAGELAEFAGIIKTTEQSVADLRGRIVRYRVALERYTEQTATRWFTVSFEERRRAREEIDSFAQRVREAAAGLEASWSALLEAVTVATRGGNRSLRSLWREETARGVFASQRAEEQSRSVARLVISYILQKFAGDDAKDLHEGAERLREHFPGAARERERLSQRLAAFEKARRLSDFSWELQSFYRSARPTRRDLERLVERGDLEAAATAFERDSARLKEILAELKKGEAGASSILENLEVSRLELESKMREVAATYGEAGAELKEFLTARSASEPERFVRWAKAAQLFTPTLSQLYASLERAQQEMKLQTDERRLVEITFTTAREEARSAKAWQKTARHLENLRWLLQLVHEDEPFVLYLTRELLSDELRTRISSNAWEAVPYLSEALSDPEAYANRPALRDALVQRGYSDTRGRLLSFPELVERDIRRGEIIMHSLVETPSSRSLIHTVRKGELTRFLDLQLENRVERPPVRAREEFLRVLNGGESLAVLLSKTYSGRDECYTLPQALHAMVNLLHYMSGWDRGEGLRKAEQLLRQQRLYAETAKLSRTGYRGQPRMFLATNGDVGDAVVEASPNAAVALAAQLHASVSGSREFLGLATTIVERVLLPLLDEGPQLRPGTKHGVLVSSPLRAAALSLAALRNEEAIAGVEGRAGDQERYQREADRLAQWLVNDCWNRDEGVFLTGSGETPDVDGNLFCLAVLASDGSFDEEDVKKAVHAVREQFGVQDTIEELVDKETFRGNWLLNGPVEAYNRLVLPIAEHLQPEALKELRPADSWLFLNRLLFDLSGGLLGFTTEAQGLAAGPSRDRLDLTSTSLGLWVLHLLGQRVDELSRQRSVAVQLRVEEFETFLREVDRLTGDYNQQLLRCTVADSRDPFCRSWPRSPVESDALPGSLDLEYEGRLTIEPACYWLFADAVRLGFHPFLPPNFDSLSPAPDRPREAGPEGSLERLWEHLRLREARVKEMLRTAGAESGSPLSVLLSLFWLERQIDSRTDLVRANEDPQFLHVSRTYTSALAIIQFTLAEAWSGDDSYLKTALRLWRGMQKVRSDEPAGADEESASVGVLEQPAWADAYDMRTGRVLPGAEAKAAGPNSWMVLAGLHLYRATEDQEVLRQAQETLDWVLGLQIEKGEHRGAVRLHEEGALIISTEANADALAAAEGMARALEKLDPVASARCRRAAKEIAGWLVKTMWLEDQGLFATGCPGGKPALEKEWLDSQTWTLLALDATHGPAHRHEPRDYNGLPILEAEETLVSYRGRNLRGFSKVTRVGVGGVTRGRDAFWPEGVAGHVLASRVVLERDRYLEDLLAARDPDGTLPYIIGENRSGGWEYDLRVRAVDGTVWTTWAEPRVNFNPFRTDEIPRLSEPLKEEPESLSAWREEAVRYLRRLEADIERLTNQLREIEGRVDELGEDMRVLPASR